MSSLFNIPGYKIDTSQFSNLLHDDIVRKFEESFCEYVGAKYACSTNSATSAIYLAFLGKNAMVNVPSIIPPVVCNAVLTSGNKINFVDNIGWVGHSYVLHDFRDYKIIDSAQKVEKNQFTEEASDQDLMIFSFYPTKPVGSCDGGMIVSNDRNKIGWFKEASLNGMTFSKDNWVRKIKFPGYKMYMNSIQAFVANENLKKLPIKNEKLDEIREKYNSSIGAANTSNHLYRINVSNRKDFIRNMKEEGIQMGVHYEALHENKIYSNKNLPLLKSSKEGATTVSLCFHENLTPKDVNRVILGVEKYAIRC